MTQNSWMTLMGGSEEGGVELSSVAITREEMNEFLQSHNTGNSVEEEEVI